MESDQHKKLDALKKQSKVLDKHLKNLDHDLLTGQISFSFESTDS